MLSVAVSDSAMPICSISGPQPQEISSEALRPIFLELCKGEPES